MTTSSRLPGFYNLPLTQRLQTVAEQAGLTSEEAASLSGASGLTPDAADHMIENVLGVYGLPLGIATNFRVNRRDVLVPMVIEEPSVVAGASLAARLAREGGGFTTSSDEPIMIAQVQVLDLVNPHAARLSLLANKQRLLDLANTTDPVVVGLGGGARDIQVRVIDDSPAGPMLVLHLLYDCRDAMGANTVNTAAEALRPLIEAISSGRVALRILSNLADHRLARASVTIPTRTLAFDDYDGELVRDRIIEAWAFAASDPYRAATHNKGIMNGVDAVVIATGNDWRAIEAGAHAYAAYSGRYTSLSQWGKDKEGNLVGTLEMPMAVGIIGGATKVHPTARAALKLMGVQTARELAEIIVAVGLAQNLAAIRALATEGIQRGHMSLHARQIAAAAGASGELVDQVAAQLVAEKKIRLDRAQELVEEIAQTVEQARKASLSGEQ
ncbi:MAG TPA: hydroxymethylglutaryl-CoA reductase, degradative [Anaerolineae bacterium]|nr:hydroxymethylglutaryl-CoA reductase, degradative [Anaerolineae bacterium]